MNERPFSAGSALPPEPAFSTKTDVFYPPRRQGLLFHGALVLGLGGVSTLAFFYGMNQRSGSFFVLFLLISLLVFAPLPWILYRAYALALASYRLERDGLRLRWGMRAEDIPLPDVEWVRRPADLATDLPMPKLHYPGAILGSVNTRDLGPMEYMAADKENMLLVATPRRIFVISPENPQAFLRTFQRTLEMGSLAPLSSVSVLPAAYLSQIWADRITRGLLIAGFILNLLLLVEVSLLLGRSGSLAVARSVEETQQLLLLPILGAFIYVIDLATGLFFYRQNRQPRSKPRLIAYVIWGSAPVTALLLIIAALMV
jgi:hypothetical protein